MDQLAAYIEKAQSSLCREISLGSLLARDDCAHKWKITYRCIILRELVAWRFFDLLKQAVILQSGQHILGARILLRSAIETVSILVYSNQKLESITKTGSGFQEFSKATENLLLGSRNDVTPLQAINILTILEKCNRKYDGILRMYEHLSESSHPNWEGLTGAYSKIDYSNYTTYFENRFVEKLGDKQASIIEILLTMFNIEYNEIWPRTFEGFEKWIRENSDSLKSG